MGNVIALVIDLKNCLGFADRFIKEEKYLDAMINLNDALKFAKTNEEKKDIYVRYLYLLTQTDNFGSAYTVLSKLIYTYCTEDCYMFDGVDMVLRNSLLFGNTDAIYVFEGLDIKAREDFIMIRELIKNENFGALFEVLPILAKPSNPYFKDMMRLVHEATVSSKFKIPKEKASRVIMQLYPKAPDNPYIVSMLLNTKDEKVIKVLEKGYRLQLEKATGNYFDLLRVGRAYMLNKRYQVATRFFNRILFKNKYDEETLWMSAQNYYLQGKRDKGRKLLNTYAALFECSDAPIGIYRAYMESNDLEATRYPNVSEKFIDSEIARITEFYKMFSPSEISVRELEDLFKVAGHKYEQLYNIVSNYPDEAMQGAVRRMLSSMRINSYHKIFLFKELVQSDYEGSFDMIYKDRIYCANILKLRARGIDKKYFQLYKDIVSLIPFCKEMIPLKCTVLAEITKSIAKRIDLDSNDMEGVAKYIIFEKYTSKLKIKINKQYYKQLFNETMSKDFSKKCKEFSL